MDAEKQECKQCGELVAVEPGQQILSCMPRQTPYRKLDQFTRVEGYTHGIGRSGVLAWVQDDE